ncbi:MAG: methionine synthase [Odoribacteraceae bacterium]|jgi:5-methyltetrahydrofolate--homocysteine methyltransferase|nr:methionine synthase [Odoribacteraceae bacterium]
MHDKNIADELKQRVLILDGATGTALQQFHLEEEDFRGEILADHPVPLKGNNDVLNLARPDLIRKVHDAYVEAGADIIETNTFSSNAVSQADYRCEALVYRLNLEGARLARESAAACEERRVYVAGSIGPTAKSLTLAPDVNRPAYREVGFDALEEAYAGQVGALIDGGVDLLLVETVYDGLNAKAALRAIARVQEEKGVNLPVMLSVTVNDRGGRLLTGQSLEAIYNSVAHYPLLSFGLNCSFGATELHAFFKELSPKIPHYLSIYPNAGLPNEMGEYDETPAFTAERLRKMAAEGLINIAGGCCGTTAAHVKAIRDALEGLPPRPLPEADASLVVSGLDIVRVNTRESNFVNIGERTNVAGSARFARAIREKQYDKAAQIAREQIEDGASIIDVNMDDAMLDSAAEMEHFLRLISNEPEIARAALMIDSSRWETLLVGLKNAPGKCIVNSISLKEGEEEFIARATEIRRLGGAVVVMAFDENGQAATFERKTAICRRAYRLLLDRVGFAPRDIIFDANVLAVATGIEEHDNYAVDFIEAVRWIKRELPGCYTSGGVSNLSFSFRGNNPAREAMHSVFLYHAIRAGLDMGIVNPALLRVYDDVEPELLQAAEDVVLNRRKDATERLVALAGKYKESAGEAKIAKNDEWRALPLEERLAHALVKGVTAHLREDIAEALDRYPSPVEIIESPLMKGMDRVGQLFGEGKMFLPQVVKAAKVMKEAVAILQPEIERRDRGETVARRPRMVIATVKGDVHDIGKNIVNIVLACNNVEVIDLGVMIDRRLIVDAVKREQADLVGVSGLITPSLGEMEQLCRLMQEEQLRVPLIVGGATTSALHTAVKLAPLYDYCVVDGGDASKTVGVVKRLLNDREAYIREIKHKQEQLREMHRSRRARLVPILEARQRAVRRLHAPAPDFGEHDLEGARVDVGRFAGLIDWTPFFHFWGFKGKYPEIIYRNEEAARLHETAIQRLGEIVAGEEFEAAVVARFFDAGADGDDILLDDRGRPHRLPMLRQQEEDSPFLSLADFLPPAGETPGVVGLFCLKVADKRPACDCRDFEHLLRESLLARLAEALAEWMQANVAGELHAIRPAFGYPSCPDHSLKKDVFDLLDATRKIGVTLTDNYAMFPTTSICGMIIAHPEARYFSAGKIGDDQLQDYSRRRQGIVKI